MKNTFVFVYKKCTLVSYHSSATNIFKKQVFHFIYMRVNYSSYSNYGKRYNKENKPVVFVHICVFPLDQQGAPHPLMCDRQSLWKLKVQLSVGSGHRQTCDVWWRSVTCFLAGRRRYKIKSRGVNSLMCYSWWHFDKQKIVNFNGRV